MSGVVQAEKTPWAANTAETIPASHPSSFRAGVMRKEKLQKTEPAAKADSTTTAATIHQP